MREGKRRLVPVARAAEQIGVTRDAVYKWIAAGKVPAQGRKLDAEVVERIAKTRRELLRAQLERLEKTV